MMQVPPRKQTVLFVGDLSSVCTEQHIRELFEVNGFNVVDIKMMGGKVTSNSFDYGFVELSSPEEAELALSTLDGTFLCGRRMRVKWAAPNVKNKPSKGIINSVHVRFQSLQPGLLVNEETLLSVFEQFGIISDVSVKSCAMNPNNGLHDGYGFVHFPCSPEGVSVALKAVSALSENPIVDNVHYSCEMSKNLLKLLQVQSQKRSQDAYAALNSHLQYSTRYNSHNFQNYALPGQGYMPGSQNSYYRNLRRPMDPSLPLDPSRLFPGAAAPPLDYSAYAYQQPPAQTRKPSYDPLSLMSPHLRPEQAQEEYPSSWAEPPQQLSGSAPAPAPLGYESSFPGSNLRLQDPYYGLNAPNAPSASRFPEPQLRYSDPRYVSDVRLMEHRHRGPSAASMAPPAAPPGIGSGIGSLARRPADPREVRPPAVPAPISASSGLGYNYSQPLGSMSQPLSQTAYKHEHGYTIEDFVDYPYPQEEPDTRLLESANGEDSSKSVDELNELLSRHSISSTTSTRIY